MVATLNTFARHCNKQKAFLKKKALDVHDLNIATNECIKHILFLVPLPFVNVSICNSQVDVIGDSFKIDNISSVIMR